MAISAQLVNELRQKTGAGMMDCKKALTESDGDLVKAVDILRKKGASVAAKRAERSANEGIIATNINNERNTGIMVEVNCETDFVAKSDDFIKFADAALVAAAKNSSGSVDALLEASPELAEMLSEVTGKVGEKTAISRVGKLFADGGFVVEYIHPGSKLGVLVLFDNLESSWHLAFEPLAKDIAMQVAAMKPLGVSSEDISKDVVEKEIEIYKELARKEGKPDKILDKIAQGKLAKFYQENCLAEQAYIKDNSMSVKELINDFNKKNGTDTKLSAFFRYHLSDEKK